MKRTLIFLACLLGITTAGRIDDYDKYWANKHKQYDYGCQDTQLMGPCLETIFADHQEEGGCREACQNATDEYNNYDSEACKACTMNHQDADLNCRIMMGYEKEPQIDR